MHTIYRFVRTGNGFKERLVIKSFKYSEDMYKFTGKQPGNLWSYCQGPNANHLRYDGMPAGTYAFAGGKYHNVKTLDASVLAHI